MDDRYNDYQQYPLVGMDEAELKQLIASNARAIQAAAEERAELRQAILKLTEIQGGIAALLSKLDEDRPTILRKLNTIEDKVDQLLDHQKNDRPAS